MSISNGGANTDIGTQWVRTHGVAKFVICVNLCSKRSQDDHEVKASDILHSQACCTYTAFHLNRQLRSRSRSFCSQRCSPWERGRCRLECQSNRRRSLVLLRLSARNAEDSRARCQNLTTSISPLRHSRTSRMKKSAMEFPMPMLMIDTGTPLYRPVMVVKPRSVLKRNGLGTASR